MTPLPDQTADRRAESELVAERVARNDATFREANERIRRAAEEYEMKHAVPFICECAAEDCSEIVQLSLAEYGEIRSDPRRFFNAHGHQSAARGAARVVSAKADYVVVEKIGRAGQVAEELDPGA